MNFLTVFRRSAIASHRKPVQPDWVEGRRHGVAPTEPDFASSWFDSSWLLRAGLQITEHESADPVSNDLPLGWWLEGPCAAPARMTMSSGLAVLSPSSRPCR